MTKGTVVLITNENIYESIQFKGGMGFSFLGQEVISVLENVLTYMELKKELTKFNNRHHKYVRRLVYAVNIDLQNMFKKDVCTTIWKSDYLYVKNATKKDIAIFDIDGKQIVLISGRVTVLFFGRLRDLEN